MNNAEETWNHIERLLHDECGLRLDEGLALQRPNLINAIANAIPSHALMSAAAELLRAGGGSLHKVRVNGQMMDREQVAAALSGAR